MGDQVFKQEYEGGAVVRDADVRDAHIIAKKMRDADRREMRAHGLTPIQAAAASILDAKAAYTLTYCNEPVLIFGVSDSQIDGLGAIWAMGTYEIRRVARQFLKHSRDWIERLGEGYEYVGNIVDDRNDVHRRWLEWCGFEFGHTICYGPLSLPFTYFLKKV